MQYGLNDKIIMAIQRPGTKGTRCTKSFFSGSRARGDNRERSDIDLAVSGGNTTVFAIEAETEIPTLLQLDIVDLNKPVQEELLQAIANEGVTLYEKI